MPVDGFQIYQIVLIALYFVFVVLCSYQIWLSFSLEFGELKLIFDRSFVLMGTLGVTTHSTILALSINGNTYPIRNFAAVTYDLRTIIGIYAFSELVRLTIEQTRMAVEMEADAFDVFQIFPGVYCLLFASMITTQVLRAQYNSFAWGIIVNCALTAILSTLLFVLWSFAWRFHQHMNELNTRLNLAPGDPKSASSTAFIRFLVLVSIVVLAIVGVAFSGMVRNGRQLSAGCFSCEPFLEGPTGIDVQSPLIMVAMGIAVVQTWKSGLTHSVKAPLQVSKMSKTSELNCRS